MHGTRAREGMFTFDGGARKRDSRRRQRGGGGGNASDGDRAGRPGSSGDGFEDAYGWDDALADSARLLAIDIGDERAT